MTMEELKLPELSIWLPECRITFSAGMSSELEAESEERTTLRLRSSMASVILRSKKKEK